MFDHLTLPVRDLARSRDFYMQALAPLGIGPAMEFPGVLALGREGRPQLWLAGSASVSAPAHLAFAAASRAQVDAFHAAALRAGGSDNGAPGLRPHYHPDYYAAFVHDPDGHNIEAVCHHPETL
ncbi:glyoxalase [Frateuria sp. Soil773]|uniref:VOC family protein n=1 Tax=Frateuria sp. Soil773 TaxID=1736407 RepID=UPI000701E643|nr:VOC family protein [Frateuria sp. Soil773]KRF00609.1 glyoxalase [Frateuria sp. Soil773]